MDAVEIGPQPGPQTDFLASQATIAIYGGEAGAGKTASIILDSLRFIDRKEFRAIVFRKTYPELIRGGGMWDEAQKFYSPLGAEMVGGSPLSAKFPSGARVEFSHLTHEKTKYDHQGGQYDVIYFDEATHFSEGQFWYLFGRLRGSSGIRPYMRATCNPDPKSFIKTLIGWWLDDDGFAIHDRSGVVRWLVRDGDKIKWGDTEAEAREQSEEGTDPISLTFIKGSLADNKILTDANPDYAANLSMLPKAERRKLKDGNWNAAEAGGLVLHRDWWQIVKRAPEFTGQKFWAWDKASTAPHAGNPDPDYSVGVHGFKTEEGDMYITDMERFRLGPMDVMSAMRRRALDSGSAVVCWQDPGQAGVVDVAAMVRYFQGIAFYSERSSKSKYAMSQQLSVQLEHKNVYLVEGAWNEALIDECHEFNEDSKSYKHDDIVDALILLSIIVSKHNEIFIV